MSKIILLHFGAFVPGIQQSAKPTTDETDEGEGAEPPSNTQMTDGCKGNKQSLITLQTIFQMLIDLLCYC